MEIWTSQFSISWKLEQFRQLPGCVRLQPTSTAILVKGLPLIVTICHCKYCQRATGSALAIEHIFYKQYLRLKSGETRVCQLITVGSGSPFETTFVQFVERNYPLRSNDGSIRWLYMVALLMTRIGLK